MSEQEIKAFNVGSLNLEGFEEAEVQSDFAGFITDAGKYNLKINKFNLSTSPKLKDGAGKQWGSLRLEAADTITGKVVVDFIPVPLETVLYTSKTGNTSSVKTKIFSSFMTSLTGVKLTAENLRAAVIDLPNILEGGTFRANVEQISDMIRRSGSDDGGYVIRQLNGSNLLSTSGAPMIFDDREAATTYYKNLKGYNPSKGLGFRGFQMKAPGK